MIARFSGCKLDSDSRRLWRGAREVHLSPKAFELLKVLVEQRKRALSKAELLELVWPGVFVSDASLARVVNEIRENLGDDGRDGRIIRTVHKYGYALAADVEEEEAEARPVGAAAPARAACWFVRGRRTFPLTEGTHVIGRDSDVSIRLDSPKVSRHHARIVVDGGSATIEDLGSKNGTFVEDLRISEPTLLQVGADVRIGPFTLGFRAGRGPFTTETEAES